MANSTNEWSNVIEGFSCTVFGNCERGINFWIEPLCRQWARNPQIVQEPTVAVAYKYRTASADFGSFM